MKLDSLVWTTKHIEFSFSSTERLSYSSYRAISVAGRIFIMFVCDDNTSINTCYSHLFEFKTNPYSLHKIGQRLKLMSRYYSGAINLTTDGSKLYLSLGNSSYCITLANTLLFGPKKFPSHVDAPIVALDNKLWAISGYDRKVENTAKLSWSELSSDARGSIDYFPLELKSGSHDINEHCYVPGIEGTVLDIVFASPERDPLRKSSISSFDLRELKRRVLVGDCGNIFDGVEWPLKVSDGGSHVLFLGHDPSNKVLSRVLVVDLAPFGYIDHISKRVLRLEKTHFTSGFSKTLESGEMCDCEITALLRPTMVHKQSEKKESQVFVDNNSAMLGPLEKQNTPTFQTSAPIKVHALFLYARWPYFRRAMTEQMGGTQDKRFHIPEPFEWVKRLVEYFYQDTVKGCNSDEISGLLILSKKYELPRLHALCVLVIRKTKILKNNPVLIWHRARQVGETTICKMAVEEILSNWGTHVRSDAFQELFKAELIQLCLEAGSNATIQGRRK